MPVGGQQTEISTATAVGSAHNANIDYGLDKRMMGSRM